MHHFLSREWIEVDRDWWYFFKWKDLSGDVVGVVFQEEARIQNYTQVALVWRQGDGGVVEKEAVVGGSSERFLGGIRIKFAVFIVQLKEVWPHLWFYFCQAAGQSWMQGGSNGFGGDVDADLISVAVEVETTTTANVVGEWEEWRGPYDIYSCKFSFHLFLHNHLAQKIEQT